MFQIGSEVFAEKDVMDARALPDIDGMVYILVTLEPAAGEKLFVLTQSQIGKALDVKLNGRILVSPTIMEPIAGGTFQISGRFSLLEGEDLARLISGKNPLPDSLDE